MAIKIPKEKPGENRRHRVLAFVRGETLSKVRDISEEEVLVWPHLLKRELLMTLTVMALLLGVSIIFNAPLEELANPAETPNPAKAPWYFAGLQELLVYFDPWIGGVMLPTIIIFGLMAIPYIDPNRDATGYYGFSERKIATTIFSFGLFLWFSLIIIGVFFRGPNWSWFWPWETWTTERVSSGVVRNLSTWAGGVGLFVYFAAGYILPYLYAKPIYERLGRLRYAVTMTLLLLMTLVPIKIILRLSFDVKYILVTPWFNI